MVQDKTKYLSATIILETDSLVVELLKTLETPGFFQVCHLQKVHIIIIHYSNCYLF